MGLRLKIWDDPDREDDQAFMDELLIFTNMSLDDLRSLVAEVKTQPARSAAVES